MAAIALLSNETIDKIAAGEVVERPVNVLKELIENSIDAGATRISAEIKNGGIDLIRVTDDGDGISPGDCRNAFLRHATSKINSIEDLGTLETLGFRGEALSSIAAVSKTELISKTNDTLFGKKINISGGVLEEDSEVGAPQGTTIIVRNLFYNTPARKKFLKSASSEAAAVEDLAEKIALSHPKISISLVINNKIRLKTEGNGQLKDVIYEIYGSDVYRSLIPVSFAGAGITVTGFICKPEYNVSSRNEEIYFVNGRYIRSNVLETAIEEGFSGFLMQHRFPFSVLNIECDPGFIDVNVHPKKMEVRFSDNEPVKQAVSEAIKNTLLNIELIPEDKECDERDVFISAESVNSYSFDTEKIPETSHEMHEESEYIYKEKTVSDDYLIKETEDYVPLGVNKAPSNIQPFEKERLSKEEKPDYILKPIDETLFEKKLIIESENKYKIIGQVFDTYWLITLDDDLFIVDQHAAHEKVNYEKFLKQFKEDSVYGQELLMPYLLNLSPLEKDVLLRYRELFSRYGFEIEEFGDSSYALRSVPVNLFDIDFGDLFHNILDELSEKEGVVTPEIFTDKLATKACKASVKGGMDISFKEMEALMQQMMKLENPYNCPHGRPTFIKITKKELEKKFKRIV